ncbi:peptidoglycan DD-metalloendopeptidase family protein [Brachybacterium sp. JHP9]|uniref:Peptidoglycan DD-metalloendopeptidase family protein n=1 Tax=Brachybacterium equifaecis TaxID=2910770 RepID=A0ABT0R3C6_9MICO|nr:M23 family metallopeptidase [Brachybacterium equifaecis]MCL6423908.1 peptidoglycan DD-metalloendopeptidase family protein [Brachybacterium equifaecis]
MAVHRPLRFLAPFALAVALMGGQAVVAPLDLARAEGTKQEKEQERTTIQQQLDDIRLQLDDVDADLADTYLALADTELRIPTAQKSLEDAQAELAKAQQHDKEVGDRLSAAQAEEARLTSQVEQGKVEIDSSDEKLSQVALQAYKGGGLPSPTSVYVGSQEPQGAVDRSMNYRLTMEAQGTRLDALRTDQAVTESAADRLTAVRTEIDDLKRQSEESVAKTAAAEQQAAAAKKQMDDLYATQRTQALDLETKKGMYQQSQSSLENRGSALDSEISALVEQERARSGTAVDAGAAPAVVSGSGWAMPSNARISSNYGWRVHPIYGTSKLHAGTDFAAACGSPATATEAGRVLSTNFNSAAGNKVIISHGMRNGKLVTSSYHHLQGFAVSPGQTVQRGQVVGRVGTTGSSTGCHLHFEIHEDGTAVNAMNYLG